MSVLVVINPLAGPGRGDLAARGRARLALARELLAREGVTGDVRVTEQPGHAEHLAREAAAAGVRRVLAWGGDGTTNEVGRALAFGDAALGLVPAGSGNGLTRALGLPLAIEPAVVRALHGTPRRVDAGELAGRLFFNVAGVGFDAEVARRFNALGSRRGFFGYLTIGLAALFDFPPQHYAVQHARGSFAGRALMVVVANGPEFGNAARIAPDARPDDGWLDLVIVEPTSPWRDVLRARHLFDGSIARRAGFTLARIEAATIAGGAGLRCHVDGEPFDAAGTIAARVHAGALQVVQ